MMKIRVLTTVVSFVLFFLWVAVPPTVSAKDPTGKYVVVIDPAHGGKDGHPYPVDRANYDRSIDFLKKAVDQAKIGRTERLHALKRLSTLV